MRKLTFLIALGIGYVLGARAGRDRYEQIRTGVDQLRNNPKVQATAHQAAETAKEQAPVIKEKVAGAATAATEKVRHVGSSNHPEDELPDESLVNQEDPYPKGDLP